MFQKVMPMLEECMWTLNLLFETLPIPEAKTNSDHSCVSILDCVSDFLQKQEDILDTVSKWDKLYSIK